MMRKMILMGTLTVQLAACSLPATPSTWEKYSFNGQEFQRGGIESRPSLWIRYGYLPRIEEPRDASRNYGKLPPKSGAVAGICYLQTSGGKLADQSGAKPLPDEQITISSRELGVSVTRSDTAGFFVEELFPGDYRLFCRGAEVSVSIKEGQTALVPIRGGKRMVD